MRSRNHMITAYNDILLQDVINHGNFRYMIYQKEQCPSTRRNHYQIYLELLEARDMKGIKNMFKDQTIHIEPRRGTQDQAIDYCSKLETRIEGPWEYGIKASQGNRSDVNIIKDLVEAGHSMRGILNRIENITYNQVKLAEKLLAYKEPRRCSKPIVIWLSGRTGMGKTKLAYDLLGSEDTWVSGGSVRWFQGYDGHLKVIFDDFRKDQVDFTSLLRLLDRYDFTVENKGGSRQFLAKVIIITSIFSPEEMYTNHNEDLNQLLRRIDYNLNIETVCNDIRLTLINEITTKLDADSSICK
jgi:hypothetical protein